jgi:transposase
MTRIAHLEPYLSATELKYRYRSATNPHSARRWQLLWLIALSKTIKEAAAVLGINYDGTRAIVKSYNQQGETAIRLKKQPSKKRPSHALLNSLQLEELRLSLAGESPDRGL